MGLSLLGIPIHQGVFKVIDYLLAPISEHGELRGEVFIVGRGGVPKITFNCAAQVIKTDHARKCGTKRLTES